VVEPSAPLDEPVAEPQPDPLAETRRERDELQDRWLRAMAELDNLRRRTVRDIDEARRLALIEVFRRLLEVQDDFERALASIPASSADDPSRAPGDRLADFHHGVELIQQRLLGVLRDFGVAPIAALGEPFDPRLHEAVGHRDEEGTESGTVVDVLQTGYTLGDVVLRPSRVFVTP
jgi:molecular chaperone GrpE